ncbi:MAG TPA: hypothetical protein VKZ67_02870 [Natronosporangium sp.]|nr:hypothetical protein [Natronosporangium sp.]
MERDKLLRLLAVVLSVTVIAIALLRFEGTVAAVVAGIFGIVAVVAATLLVKDSKKETR